MGRGSAAPGGSFHETPLVLFTALGTAGAGIGAANLLEGALAGTLPGLARPEAVLLSLLLGVGLLLSAGHLGRPRRSLLALRRLGRSALSNEILALGAALGGGLLSAALPSGHALRGVSGLVAGAGSLAFLLALGAVYRLPGQPAWRGGAFLHPLVLGTAWGLLAGMAFPEAGGVGGWFGEVGGPASPVAVEALSALWLGLLADGLLTASRWFILEGARTRGEAPHPRFFRFRRGLLGGRLVLSSLLTPLALISGLPVPALLALSLALVLDRLAFYALAVRETTESEMARVEALL